MTVAGVLAGLAIGVVASLLGVAGGELLIPTIVLLFAVDIKLAVSLALAIGLPTMIVGFARYSRDGSIRVLRENRTFLLVMTAGSLIGSLIGASLLGTVPSIWLMPALAIIPVVPAWKIWQHRQAAACVKMTWPRAYSDGDQRTGAEHAARGARQSRTRQDARRA